MTAASTPAVSVCSQMPLGIQHQVSRARAALPVQHQPMRSPRPAPTTQEHSMSTTHARRPFRRGVKVRTLRTRGGIPARSVCTIVDVHPHGGGYRYRIAWQTSDGALLAEEWIAGRDVVRASRSHYRPVEVSQ